MAGSSGVELLTELGTQMLSPVLASAQPLDGARLLEFPLIPDRRWPPLVRACGLTERNVEVRSGARIRRCAIRAPNRYTVNGLASRSRNFR
jgi:hypothetical protein